MKRAVVVTVLASACILPPPVTLEEGQNERPYVIANRSLPKEAQVEINLNCQSFCFQLYADDPDAGDILTTHWFWDYDAGLDTPASTGHIGAISNGAERNFNNYQFPVDHQYQQLLNATGATIHTLSIVVSDRDFLNNQEPVNQAIPAGALSTQFRWTVSFINRGTTCDTPPPCSGSQ